MSRREAATPPMPLDLSLSCVPPRAIIQAIRVPTHARKISATFICAHKQVCDLGGRGLLSDGARCTSLGGGRSEGARLLSARAGFSGVCGACRSGNGPCAGGPRQVSRALLESQVGLWAGSLATSCGDVGAGHGRPIVRITCRTASASRLAHRRLHARPTSEGGPMTTLRSGGGSAS